MNPNYLTGEIPKELAEAIAKIEAAAHFLQSRFVVANLREAHIEAVISNSWPWLNRDKAALYCCCSTGEIDRAARVGIIKPYYRGSSPIYNREDLDAALKSGKWKHAYNTKGQQQHEHENTESESAPGS